MLAVFQCSYWFPPAAQRLCSMSIRAVLEGIGVAIGHLTAIADNSLSPALSGRPFLSHFPCIEAVFLLGLLASDANPDQAPGRHHDSEPSNHSWTPSAARQRAMKARRDDDRNAQRSGYSRAPKDSVR